MRKEWNIETVNITPTAPKPQDEKQPDTNGGKIVQLFKKHWMKTLLILLCVYFSFFLFGMLVSDYYVDENGKNRFYWAQDFEKDFNFDRCHFRWNWN